MAHTLQVSVSDALISFYEDGDLSHQPHKSTQILQSLRGDFSQGCEVFFVFWFFFGGVGGGVYVIALESK